jgi:hypothetical protein
LHGLFSKFWNIQIKRKEKQNFERRWWALIRRSDGFNQTHEIAEPTSHCLIEDQSSGWLVMVTKWGRLQATSIISAQQWVASALKKGFSTNSRKFI